MCLAQIPKLSDDNAEVLVSFPGDFLQQKLAITAAGEYMIAQDSVVGSLDILNARFRECILHSEPFPSKKVNAANGVVSKASRPRRARFWDTSMAFTRLLASRSSSGRRVVGTHHTQRAKLSTELFGDARPLSTMARHTSPTVEHQHTASLALLAMWRRRLGAQGGFESDEHTTAALATAASSGESERAERLHVWFWEAICCCEVQRRTFASRLEGRTGLGVQDPNISLSLLPLQQSFTVTLRTPFWLKPRTRVCLASCF